MEWLTAIFLMEWLAVAFLMVLFGIYRIPFALFLINTSGLLGTIIIVEITREEYRIAYQCVPNYIGSYLADCSPPGNMIFNGFIAWIILSVFCMFLTYVTILLTVKKQATTN